MEPKVEGAHPHHKRFGVTTKGVLEQPRETRVTVGNVRTLAIHQGRNYVAQGGQRKIDLGCFHETLAFRSGLALPL